MLEYRLIRPTINGERSAVWYAVWRENGRSHRASSGERDKGRAEEWLELFKSARENPSGAWTVKRILDAYLSARPSPQGKVSANRLLPHFGAMRPHILKQGNVQAYIKKRAVDVSEATYATELRYLRAALNWAWREGHIDQPRPFRIPAGKQVRYRFFTEAEVERLIAATETLRMRLFMEIAIATASRPAKIYALTWRDIDPQAKIIYFEQGNATKRTRPVPINRRLQWVLGVAFQARLSEYVIERSGKPVKSLAKQFRDVCMRAQVQDAKLRDFRGTAASWALQRGAKIETVADLLGDSVEVVERHYGHFSPSHIASVTDLLG